MIRTIGNYEVKLTGTSNLITVYKNNELIFGKTVSAQDTGSAFNSICEQLIKKINK